MKDAVEANRSGGLEAVARSAGLAAPGTTEVVALAVLRDPTTLLAHAMPVEEHTDRLPYMLDQD